MPVPVSICDYDPAWPARFEAARFAISMAVGVRLVAVEHIGSTFVPGLAAKPVIDVMPSLRRFEDGHACVAPLEALGYVYRGEYGISRAALLRQLQLAGKTRPTRAHAGGRLRSLDQAPPFPRLPTGPSCRGPGVRRAEARPGRTVSVGNGRLRRQQVEVRTGHPRPRRLCAGYVPAMCRLNNPLHRSLNHDYTPLEDAQARGGAVQG